MLIEQSIEIEAPLDRVWTVLVDEFHEPSRWATPIHESRKLDNLGPLGVPNREIRTPFPLLGAVEEILETCDERERTMSYRVVEGGPRFALHMSNTWKLEPIGPGQTRASMRLRMEFTPAIEALIGALTKRALFGQTSQVCEDLRVYAETGQPSAKKQRRIGRSPAASLPATAEPRS